LSTVTPAESLLLVMLAGLALYVLFGGADFGAGIWHLLAGRGRKGARRRALLEHSIGPVWEANHVWLIFVIVMLWTGFPSVFAAIMSTLYIPMTLLAVGIIARGSAFAFRKAAVTDRQRAAYGYTFAAASLLTPFFLGTVGGAVASGRVPDGIAAGDLVQSWWNPTSVLCGLLGVSITAYLAAVYVTADARRGGENELADYFRGRALASGLTCGVLAGIGLVVVRADSPQLWESLIRDSRWWIGLSLGAGLVSLALLWRRAYLSVRITASLAVTALLGGWASAQWPFLLPDVTVSEAAASVAVLKAVLWALVGGAVLLVPSFVALYVVFQRPPADEGSSSRDAPTA
jgi:cytochrome d ubiquinol oxidase subunit II